MLFIGLTEVIFCNIRVCLICTFNSCYRFMFLFSKNCFHFQVFQNLKTCLFPLFYFLILSASTVIPNCMWLYSRKTHWIVFVNCVWGMDMVPPPKSWSIHTLPEITSKYEVLEWVGSGPRPTCTEDGCSPTKQRYGGTKGDPRPTIDIPRNQ